MVPRLTTTRIHRKPWLLWYVYWVLGSDTRRGHYTLIDLAYLGVGTWWWYVPAVRLFLWRYF